MWRWWVPILIGFDSPKITGAQAMFSKALMNQPHMKSGYTTRMSDVEHTAEDSADAITPMMHIDPENDLWRKYALGLADFMEKYWTARNQRGFLQFKSTYFTADKIDAGPQRACDTVYHPRVVKPTLLYWQRTGGERLTKLFAAWMDTWVDAAARSERGKPITIIYRPDPSLLYSMVTGDPGDALYFPLNAVHWLTPPRDIAVLVTESAANSFGAELFVFGEKERSMSAEFYLLEPGRYKLTITINDNDRKEQVGTCEFSVESRRTRVDFKLPPRELCMLNISRL